MIWVFDYEEWRFNVGRSYGWHTSFLLVLTFCPWLDCNVIITWYEVENPNSKVFNIWCSLFNVLYFFVHSQLTGRPSKLSFPQKIGSHEVKYICNMLCLGLYAIMPNDLYSPCTVPPFSFSTMWNECWLNSSEMQILMEFKLLETFWFSIIRQGD